jgi:hypothetical protein
VQPTQVTTRSPGYQRAGVPVARSVEHAAHRSGRRSLSDFEPGGAAIGETSAGRSLWLIGLDRTPTDVPGVRPDAAGEWGRQKRVPNHVPNGATLRDTQSISANPNAHIYRQKACTDACFIQSEGPGFEPQRRHHHQEWMGHAVIQTTMRYLRYVLRAEDWAVVHHTSKSRSAASRAAFA